MKKIESEYTSRIIKNNFIQLVLENGYDNVTITSIARRCEINRTTFYLFYSSKEELAREIFEETLTSLTDDFFSVYSDWGDEAIPIIKKHFIHFKKEAPVIKALFSIKDARFVPYIELKVLFENSLLNLKNKNKDIDKDNLNLFCIYTATNAVATIEWWVNNCDYHTEDYIVEIIQKSLNTGFFSLLN